MGGIGNKSLDASLRRPVVGAGLGNGNRSDPRTQGLLTDRRSDYRSASPKSPPRSQDAFDPEMTERSYSPRTVADALGVSESSLKRWCDQGKLEISKTAGGHRRIPRAAALAFARTHHCDLAKPELLGLPDLKTEKPTSLEEARASFLESVLEGRETACRRILIQLFLDGHSVAALGDHLIAPTFHQVGQLWACSRLDIYQERLGCEICLRLLHELRGMLSSPGVSAPLAIGGTPEGDLYSLPTALVELVAIEHGFRAVNLGTHLPISTLESALRRYRPRLFWLSASSIEDPDRFVSDYERLFEASEGRVAMVVGGRAIDESIRKRIRYTLHCDRLEVLETFLQTLFPKPARPSID